MFDELGPLDVQIHEELVDVHFPIAGPVRSIKDFLKLHEVALLLVQFRPDVAAAVVIGIFFYGLAEEPAHGLSTCAAVAAAHGCSVCPSDGAASGDVVGSPQTLQSLCAERWPSPTALTVSVARHTGALAPRPNASTTRWRREACQR